VLALAHEIGDVELVDHLFAGMERARPSLRSSACQSAR
jgi:hypothetical protein